MHPGIIFWRRAAIASLWRQSIILWGWAEFYLEGTDIDSLALFVPLGRWAIATPLAPRSTPLHRHVPSATVLRFAEILTVSGWG